MNFTCNRETLQKYVIAADRVTGKNLPLPILNLVLLSANNKSLVVRATNLEVGVEFTMNAHVATEGSVAIPGALLANILSGMSDEEIVTMSAKGGVCTLTTKTKRMIINGSLSDDFPTIPIIHDGEDFMIHSSKFIQGIRSVMMSASISDIKPEIASVYLYQSGSSLICVATDSLRLAEKKINYVGNSISHGAIIPIKNIIEIVKVCELVNDDVIGKITKNQISWMSGSIYVTSRLIQGVYPDYEQIIPKEYATEIVILKQDLINTLKLSTLFADKFNKIILSVNPEQKKCLISTKNSGVGEIESNLTVMMSGEPIEILLNGKHIFDCLSSIDRDSIAIHCNGFNKPVVISGFGDPSFTYLTMPLTS